MKGKKHFDGILLERINIQKVRNARNLVSRFSFLVLKPQWYLMVLVQYMDTEKKTFIVGQSCQVS